MPLVSPVLTTCGPSVLIQAAQLKAVAPDPLEEGDEEEELEKGVKEAGAKDDGGLEEELENDMVVRTVRNGCSSVFLHMVCVDAPVYLLYCMFPQDALPLHLPTCPQRPRRGQLPSALPGLLRYSASHCRHAAAPWPPLR
jgi:hypothetical protein